MARVKKRATYHHGSLREALVEAARRLLDKQGVAGLSLREVARRVGVSPNAQYRHFHDKADLLAAVAEQGFRELTAGFLSAAGPSEGERFRAMAVVYVDFASANPALMRLMFSELLAPFDRYPTLQSASRDCFSQLLGAAARTMGREPGDMEALPFALAAWSLVHGYSILRNDGAFRGMPIDLPTVDRLACLLRP